MEPTDIAAARRPSQVDWLRCLADDDIYQVSLDRPQSVVYGIAYRVDSHERVIVTALIPESQAEQWNHNCDIDKTICTGDSIVKVNEKSVPEDMIAELRGSADNVIITLVKTGPRWHLKGVVSESMDKVYRVQEKGYALELLKPEDIETPEETDLTAIKFAAIFCLIGLPNLFLVAAFSDVGIGFKIYEVLAPTNRNTAGNILMFMATFIGTCLYISDWTKWGGWKQRAATACAVVYTFLVGGFLKSRFYPQVPLVVSLFHIAVFIGVMRITVLRSVKRVSFYKAVSANLFLWAFGVLLIWLVWMFTGEQGLNGWKGQHTWTDATKRLLVEDANALYKEFKLDIRGESRRTYYDLDCDAKTKTGRICSESICKSTISNPVQLAQSVGKTLGVWCCTTYGTCTKAKTPEVCSASRINTAITLKLVYKVEGAIMCCSDAEMTDDEKEEKSDNCAKTKTIWFLVWITPFVCFGVDLLLAVFCFANGVYLNTTDASKLERTLKQFVIMVACLLLMMWVSSAIAGASMRLTGTLMAFCATGLVALFIWVYLEVGRSAINIGMQGSRLMKSLVSIASNDWVRALALIALNMLIPAAFVINMMNQSARRARGTSKSDGYFTEGANYILKNVQNWNWASILIKVNWWCLLYWLMSIGVAKLTSVFLSWLNEQLLEIPLASVVVIFFVIGFIMFLLPPVPGLPVYMAAGVVIPSRARTTDVGFWGGVAIAIAESFVLKLTASTGQYLIGYTAGKSVKIQQMVGVDKVIMKAIQQILEMPGLKLPKVSVLIGGPDWPTSVLCGVLRLNLCQIIWGTCPVILVSAPVVLAGSFMAGPSVNDADNDSDSGLWETLTPVMIGIAFMGQMASAVIAVYYTQEVIYKDGVQLAIPRKEHEPVARLTKAEEQFNTAYNEVLDWRRLLTISKIPLVFSTVGLMFSNFVFVFMDEACFRPFKVTGKIGNPYDQEGLNNNALSIYRWPGIATHVLFIICTIIHIGFLQRAKGAAKRRMMENRKKLEKVVEIGQLPTESQEKRITVYGSGESRPLPFTKASNATRPSVRRGSQDSGGSARPSTNIGSKVSAVDGTRSVAFAPKQLARAKSQMMRASRQQSPGGGRQTST